MLRETSANLQTILPACRLRDTFDLYLSNGARRRLARGKVIRTIDGETIEYSNWIKSVSALEYSLSDKIDSVTVVCQNVNSLLGFDVASSMRLLDYAHALLGKVYQSATNPALTEDVPVEFAGLISSASANEQEVKFEIIADYEAIGSVVANYTLSPRCWWVYKNGIECTSVSNLPDCPKTRAACQVRGKEWEFGGWEFFEQPVGSAPGGGGNDTTGGGLGGGTGGGDRDRPCFTGDTLVWTPRGSITFEEYARRFHRSNFRQIYSFNEQTGAIEKDTVEELFEHQTEGFFTLTFDDGRSVKVTPEHPFWNEHYHFVAAAQLKLNDSVWSFLRGKWKKSKLVKIKWHTKNALRTNLVKVYNFRVRKNQTYFANRFAVHNVKLDPYRDQYRDL